MSRIRAYILIVFLSLVLLACGNWQSPVIVAQNNQNMSPVSKSKSSDNIVIRRGTVGTIEKFSIGVRSVDSAAQGSATASLAIWSPSLPQVERNDYNLTLTVASGEVIPIGSKLYQVGKIRAGDGKTDGGEVEIETKPRQIAGVSLQENSLAIPVKAVLELHGFAVELKSAETINGKTVAKLEIYSNNYPKQELVKNHNISEITVATGDEIIIGVKKHKVIAVTAGQENLRGMLEVTIEPV